MQKHFVSQFLKSTNCFLRVTTSIKITNKIQSADFSNSKDISENVVMQPFRYLESMRGTVWPVKIVKPFNFWLNVPLGKCNQIEEIGRMNWNAVLLIDDIEDDSRIRRGVPVAHRIFSVASTINSANYVYFLHYKNLLKLGHPKAVEIFTDLLLEFHKGQGMEIYWKDYSICPSEEEYKTMVRRKTGAGLNLVVQLMQLFSDDKRDFTKMVEMIAVYFQVQNDYSSFRSTEYAEGNGYVDDLTEGKFSFPVMHAVRNTQGDLRMLSILKQRPVDLEIKKYAVNLMDQAGSFEYCRNTLKELDIQAREEIERLGHNPDLHALLDELKLGSDI